jgi:hypothetical protein
MSGSKAESDRRRERAGRALKRLGSHRSGHQKVGIQCRRAHHLAAVYLTADGLVYEARIGPHSHGPKDFIDTGRSGSLGGIEYVDFLEADPTVDDAVPAWCDCGPRTLSRAELLAFVRAGVPSVSLE